MCVTYLKCSFDLPTYVLFAAFLQKKLTKQVLDASCDYLKV